MKRRSKAREVALQMLFQRDLNPRVPLAEAEELARGRLREEELVEFCLGIYHGVAERQKQLDGQLTAAAENWRLSRMAAVDRNVLRMGAWELLHSETPAKVALNEAIELARRFGSASSPAFVNGVLDRLLRSTETTPSSE